MTNLDESLSPEVAAGFSQMALSQPVLTALEEVGYEVPSPIQAQTIPLLIEGRDVLGQAQTGTGKTAAFALPLLSNINIKQQDPQYLVLAPTRELAIQVAEAFQKYAHHIKGFHVLPIYGGQEYGGQIRALKRGVHVVVGTPGRVMDHIRKGTLKLDSLKAMVLDEADEMLRMGFIDDVEWILEQTPEQRQIALFSATMPDQIRRIATKYLNNPEQITVKMKATTADTIRQRFWPVSGTHKLDALTRILEAEDYDAMIIFVRTKNSTVELAEKLEARGHSVAALNGDIPQNLREKTIDNIKKGRIDIIVATDVAARGLDVERMSHVVNYDIPYDTEAYVHRIGRTGRAGRKGDAILFVAPREKRMLASIERATKTKIERMELPTTETINDKRVASFKQKISDTLANEELEFFSQMIESYQQEHNIPSLEIAAALARLLQGDEPFLLQNKPERKQRDDWDRPERAPRDKKQRRSRDRDNDRGDRYQRGDRGEKKDQPLEEGMERYRVEVGHNHKVKPGNIVGAIANEAEIDSKYIGRIEIYDDYSTVDMPEGMPKEVLTILRKARVAGKPMEMAAVKGAARSASKSKEKLGLPEGARSGKARGDRSRSDRGRSDRGRSERGAPGSKPKAKKPKSNSSRPNPNKGKPKPKTPK